MQSQKNIKDNLHRRYIIQKIAFGLIHLITWVIIAVLVIIVLFLVINGGSVISWEFLTDIPRERFLFWH